MDQYLDISIEGALGVIALDRPRAINALTLGMLEGIAATLDKWAADPAIRAVLIEGRGERGFCAGGDVRATREQVLAGNAAAVKAFFAREYAVNGQIATYAKPVITLQDGIVMGGGIGLSSHARYRIATERARFAMPEAAIGLFCDVGVNALVAEAPEAAVLAFFLGGEPVAPADAVALNLTDTIVPAERLANLRAGLAAAVGADDPEGALVELIALHAVEPDPAEFCDGAEAVAACFVGHGAVDILAALTASGDPFAIRLAEVAAKRCPTSNEVNVLAHRAAREDPGIGAVLRRDYNLAVFLAMRPDFAEGVRAVLVDKDQAPHWGPAALRDEIVAVMK